VTIGRDSEDPCRKGISKFLKLSQYESVHKLGEESKRNGTDDSGAQERKGLKCPSFNIPYTQQQHTISTLIPDEDTGLTGSIADNARLVILRRENM
jgi:hypothetical protein